MTQIKAEAETWQEKFDKDLLDFYPKTTIEIQPTLYTLERWAKAWIEQNKELILASKPEIKAQEILAEIFDCGYKDLSDLQLQITLNPSLEKIKKAMEKFASQFREPRVSPLPIEAAEKDNLKEILKKIEMKSWHKNEWGEMEEINKLSKEALNLLAPDQPLNPNRK